MKIISETVYKDVADLFTIKETPLVLGLFENDYFRMKFGRYGSSYYDIVTEEVRIGYRAEGKEKIITFKQKVSNSRTINDYNKNFDQARQLIQEILHELRIIKAGMLALDSSKPLTLENYATPDAI